MTVTARSSIAARAPSAASLRALDALILSLAGLLAAFGPYVAAFLASQGWSQENIGFVLTAAGLAGLLTQMPAGELLDTIRAKRFAAGLGAALIAAGALAIALRPSFSTVLLVLLLQGSVGGLLGLAVAAVSLGLVGPAALAERLGRNQRFASVGGVVAAGLMGLIAYALSYRAIFIASAAFVVPLLAALKYLRPADVHFGSACGAFAHNEVGPPPRALRLSLGKNRSLLTFAACIFLFQMANASMLPLAGEALAYGKGANSPLVFSALIAIPQVIVALMAPWAGRMANLWGRKPLLFIGFAALPIRACVFASTSDPIPLVLAQLLDGVSGTMLGVLTPLTVADVTVGSGRFNLAQGFVGTLSGLGASLSTTFSGQIAQRLGQTASFAGIAAVALAGLLLLALRLPETSHELTRPRRMPAGSAVTP